MSKLPLELLMEKYIPVSKFSEQYGISEEVVNSLIKSKRVRVAEFRADDGKRRIPHINYEEVLKVLEEENK